MIYAATVILTYLTTKSGTVPETVGITAILAITTLFCLAQTLKRYREDQA